MITQDSDDPDGPVDAPALAALAELGRDAAKPHTTGELDQGLRAVRARIAIDGAQRRLRRRRALLAATAAVCVAAALKIASVKRAGDLAPEPPVLVSRIDGGTLLEGGYLSQSGRAGVKVLFSEGSTFALMPGTRGRLRSVAESGAHLAVENGTASLEVTPIREHRWLVEAGPFLVTVRGTAFTVSWDPSSERFELRLRHGQVVVSGPVVNAGVPLRAGQRLVVNLPKAETVITADEGEEAASAPADAAPAAVTPLARRAGANGVGARAATKETPAPAATSPAKGPPARRWAADLASGHWDRILADVDRDGVNATLETAASDDLFALADAARYRRRADLARAALLAHRRRFPHAPRSLDAIFLLGRAEELRERGTEAQAIAWYDEYLAVAPTGAFAAEALGRMMILTNEKGGPAKARPIAREYLLRFPTGSYAGAARALERVP
jgi:hypothetical protein